MLIERGFILSDLGKVIEEQLGIKEEDIRVCCDCGKWYTKDMVIELSDEEVEKEYLSSYYRCLHCDDLKKSTNDTNGNVTDYYQMVCKELREYKKKHPL